MASTAEQVASTMSLASFAKATDLKKRLWFTLGALIVFRLLSFVPLPGIDPTRLAALFDRTQGGVLDFFNMFAGGSLQRMSLIALGVMPYITASIVMQLHHHVAAAGAPERGRAGARRSTIYPLRHRLPVRDPGYFLAAGSEIWGATRGLRRCSSGHDVRSRP